MSLCDSCIHDVVCGLEDNHEEGITFCGNMIPKTEILSRRDVLELIGGEYGVWLPRAILEMKGVPQTESKATKTGHWKRISMDKYSEHAKYWYRCDRCGKDNLGDTNYCPSCGCRMVEPQERSGEE